MGEGRGEGKTTAPLSDGLNAVTDNRLKTYNGTSYYYDNFGNLIHRELADGEVQNYFYDLHDQLVKAEIFKKDGTKETWAYSYGALGRRIGKGRLKNEEVSETSFPHDLSGNDLENHTRFVWETAATSCRKPTRTADIPISTQTRIPTNRWHKSATGQTEKARANRKSTTSTATTSASQER